MTQCERCGDAPATDRLQCTLDDIPVGSPINVCSSCRVEFEEVSA